MEVHSHPFATEEGFIWSRQKQGLTFERQG